MSDNEKNVTIFSEIVESIKSNPNSKKGRNGITGGTTYTFNGVTLTDHSNTPIGKGSPFLRIDDEEDFLVMHSYKLRENGPKIWVEGKGNISGRLSVINSRLGQPASRVA